MAEERKISPAVIIPIGLVGLGLAAALGIYTIAQAAPRYPRVYEAVGVRDANLAEGEPDGTYAVLWEVEGNYLALQLFDEPTPVTEIDVYLVNVYNYPVSGVFNIETSVDGINWVLVYEAKLLPAMPIGSEITTVPINAEIKFVRIIQRHPGIAYGIDAVEAIAPAAPPRERIPIHIIWE